MKYSNSKSLLKQVNSLRTQFAQVAGAPFNDVLSMDLLSEAFESFTGYRDRIFSPLVTLSAFLFQVLSPDHSCREAVAQVLAARVFEGQKACSSATAAYCKARQRLPEKSLKVLLQGTASCLEKHSDSSSLWKGRCVKIVDGTMVSMPDTKANQEAYPQQPGQKEGLGFSIARLVALISLSSGVLINIAMGPYAGKETGEHSLFRELIHHLSPGNLLLGDKYYCSYFLIAQLIENKVDLIFPLHARRKADFRKGKRFGNKDHLVTWKKPVQHPQWMDEAAYQAAPEFLTLRESKVSGKVLVSTLLNPEEASKKEIGKLYEKRWCVEVDLKTIKETSRMDVLRCKTPAMARKEISVHLIAYNLIRTLMAQKYQKTPRQFSPKATIQLLNAFRAAIGFSAPQQLPHIFQALWNAISQQLIGKRPGRREPRVKKRRHKNYSYMQKPRDKLRKKLKAFVLS